MRKRNHSRPDVTALTTRFGSIVRDYRRRLGISQEELAWRAGLHRTYIADIERGRRNITLSSIARLIDALGVRMAEFFFALEEHFQPPVDVPKPPTPTGERTRGAKSARARSGPRPRAPKR